jgi:TetR/AcrR family transcriptional regulator, repressor of fatR-cypB operon
MAKITDTSKIERIKEAAMMVMVEKGYSGSTISEIAKTAKVSDGYLYRFYKSKTDLFQDVYETYIKIFHDLILEIFNKNKSIEGFIKEYVSMLFTDSINEPILFKFIFIMSHDYTFPIPQKPLQTLKAICGAIIKKGIATGEINEELTPEEVYSLIIGFPPKYVDSRMRDFFGGNIKKLNNDIESISSMCVKALK